MWCSTVPGAVTDVLCRLCNACSCWQNWTHRVREPFNHHLCVKKPTALVRIQSEPYLSCTPAETPARDCNIFRVWVAAVLAPLSRIPSPSPAYMTAFTRSPKGQMPLLSAWEVFRTPNIEAQGVPGIKALAVPTHPTNSSSSTGCMMLHQAQVPGVRHTVQQHQHTKRHTAHTKRGHRLPEQQLLLIDNQMKCCVVQVPCRGPRTCCCFVQVTLFLCMHRVGCCENCGSDRVTPKRSQKLSNHADRVGPATADDNATLDDLSVLTCQQ